MSYIFGPVNLASILCLQNWLQFFVPVFVFVFVLIFSVPVKLAYIFCAPRVGLYFSCLLSWVIFFVGSATDFWGRGPGFESGFSHNDPGALQDHCAIL